jgi:capsular exopolysaccharide synthesis family protein
MYEDTMEFRQFLNIIYRYKYIIIPMCLSAVITATMLTYVFSEKYKSSTTVLIRPQKTIDLVPKREEMLDFPIGYFTTVETASKTYTEIIKSRAIAERVVQRLGLDKLKEDEGTGLTYYWKKSKRYIKDMILKTWILLKYGRIEEDNPYNTAVGKVQGGLSVKPTKETFLFELQAESSSPVVTAAIANAATQVFVEYLKEMDAHDSSNSKELSKDRIQLSRRKLEEFRKAVVDFKMRHGIVSLEKEVELELEALAGLEKSLESVNTTMTGLNAKKQDIKTKIAELHRYSKSATRITENPLITELQSQLARNEVKLAGLRKRFGEEHREVQALRAEISEIEDKLNTETPMLNSEETMSVDPVYQDLLSELSRIETAYESLRAERVRLMSTVRVKKDFIERLPELEAELASLELNEKMNEETHQLLTREYEEIAITNDKQSPDITVVSNAAAPLYPARPIKIYHAGLAGILSLIIGIGIALLMENMNVTIRSIDEAEQRLALPVLMTIPDLGSANGHSPPLINNYRKLPFEEKRMHERAYVQFPVQIVRTRDSLSGQGVASDLSIGGICCYMEKEMGLQPEDAVKISIAGGDEPEGEVVLEGVVVRSDSTISGYDFSTTAIKYENVDDSSSSKIKEIVQGTKSDLSINLPSYFEEPIRGLRSDMLFLKSKGMSSFLITSCGPGEGKSTVVSNLAISLAEINRRVLVIDADLRSPAMHTILELPNEAGLSGILSAGEQPFIKKTRFGFSVLTSGPPINDPSALLGSFNMNQLFKSLHERFDFILLDSPPLLAGPDSALIASMVHGAIIVLNSGNTTVDDFKRARHILDRADAKILGIVMNKFEKKVDSYYNWS